MIADAASLPQPILTGITNNWTRVRPSFFRGLAKSLEYAEDKCFGLILDSTVGYGRTWSKISWTRFCNVAAVTRRRCEQAVASLLGKEDPDQPGVFWDGPIRQRKAADGSGYEYAVAARPQLESTGIAKCRGCGQIGEVDLDLEFIPVPHSFFISLPASCDHGMYLIVKTVVERTMRWDRTNKQIVVVPCQITIEEFERATGKKRSEILQDLQKVQAEGYEFIAAERIGRNNWYWARPENFASAPARAAREVQQPKERNKRETGNGSKQNEVVEPARPTRPAEFVTAPCGVCRNCNTYGPMDMVDSEEKAPRKPISTLARAGPAQNGPRKPQFIQDLDRRKAEAIADGLRRLG